MYKSWNKNEPLLLEDLGDSAFEGPVLAHSEMFSSLFSIIGNNPILSRRPTPIIPGGALQSLDFETYG